MTALLGKMTAKLYLRCQDPMVQFEVASMQFGTIPLLLNPRGLTILYLKDKVNWPRDIWYCCSVRYLLNDSILWDLIASLDQCATYRDLRAREPYISCFPECKIQERRIWVCNKRM